LMQAQYTSDFRQVWSFPLGTMVFSSNKSDFHDTYEILVKVVLNTLFKNKTQWMQENHMILNVHSSSSHCREELLWLLNLYP
jgi:hypothetical protein